MHNEIVDVIIKMFSLNFFVFILFFKIRNQKYDYMKIIISSIIISILYAIEKQHIKDNIFFLISSAYILQNLFLIIILKDRKSIFVNNFIANAMVYILYCVAATIMTMIKLIFRISFEVKYQTLDILIILIMEAIFLKYIMKLKRIKNGLSFLQDPIGNEYFSMMLMEISAIVIFAYCIVVNSNHEFSWNIFCLLYTSPSPRDYAASRMPSSA